MKKFFVSVFICYMLSLLSISECYCPPDGVYVAIGGGGNFLQTQMHHHVKYRFNSGYMATGSFGYCASNQMRIEAEYNFRRNSLQSIKYFNREFSLSGRFQSSSYMVNVLCDSSSCDEFHTYVGAGIGYDFQQLHASALGYSISEHKKNLAWQVIIGGGYPVSCNANITLEYKFHKGGYCFLYDHSLGIGLNYFFRM